MPHSHSRRSRKILIFIVAYEAEKHIQELLSAIPPQCLNSQEFKILMIDDCSKDSTADKALSWASENLVHTIEIRRSTVNLGYGGNQKLGYRYAIENDFDAVILLHGDAQYDPRNILPAVKMMQDDVLDVVLGSRMFSLVSARRGGMPIYKLFGNRILTGLQNWITGQKLTEYHTGFRGYSTRFLRSIPFEINSNDFHFDTEILLQAFHVNAKLREFPISTRYADEICRVNGIKYAWNVLRVTAEYWTHRHGFACSLKYPRTPATYYRDKTDLVGSTHELARGILRTKRAARVLDIGGGSSVFGPVVRQMNGFVCGIDQEEQAGQYDQFYRLDLENDPMPVSIFDFDAILMLDFIEHLAKPEDFLIRIRSCKESIYPSKPPLVLISTPNIAFIAVRILLLFGRFNYAERGILDITHKRLFTKKSLLKTLELCGYDVLELIPVGVPFELVSKARLARALSYLANLAAKIWPEGFAFQFFIMAQPRRSSVHLLEMAERYSHHEFAQRSAS